VISPPPPRRRRWSGTSPTSLRGKGGVYLATVIDFYSNKVIAFAIAESFFAALKNELVNRTAYPNWRAAMNDIARHIETR